MTTLLIAQSPSLLLAFAPTVNVPEGWPNVTDSRSPPAAKFPESARYGGGSPNGNGGGTHHGVMQLAHRLGARTLRINIRDSNLFTAGSCSQLV